MNIILLGPPGSGKGTQSSHLAKNFILNHLSTGDILRSEIVSGSNLGKEASKYMNEGNLVPDEVIIGMVSQKLSRIDSVLLDLGFLESHQVKQNQLHSIFEIPFLLLLHQELSSLHSYTYLLLYLT